MFNLDELQKLLFKLREKRDFEDLIHIDIKVRQLGADWRQCNRDNIPIYDLRRQNLITISKGIQLLHQQKRTEIHKMSKEALDFK